MIRKKRRYNLTKSIVFFTKYSCVRRLSRNSSYIHNEVSIGTHRVPDFTRIPLICSTFTKVSFLFAICGNEKVIVLEFWTKFCQRKYCGKKTWEKSSIELFARRSRRLCDFQLFNEKHLRFRIESVQFNEIRLAKIFRVVTPTKRYKTSSLTAGRKQKLLTLNNL